MPQIAVEIDGVENGEVEIDRVDQQEEDARLAALISTGILDTPPEPAYDAITRLAAEYFQADSAGLSFADDSRVWMKSCWRQVARELPRKNSIFNLVIAEDGPVIVPDISRHPQRDLLLPRFKQLAVASFASVPVRSSYGRIIGVLTVLYREARPGDAAGGDSHTGEPGRHGLEPAGTAQTTQEPPWERNLEQALPRCRTATEAGRGRPICGMRST